MRRANHHVAAGYASRARNDVTRLHHDIAWQRNQITNHQRRLRAVLFEDDSLGVQFIMGVGGESCVVITGHRHWPTRRDAHGGGTSAEISSPQSCAQEQTHNEDSKRLHTTKGRDEKRRASISIRGRITACRWRAMEMWGENLPG